MEINSFSSLCDDFYIDMYINTELDLPTQRDTVLAFFERVQKQFPSLSRFYRRSENEYCLEEDRCIGQHNWITLERDRVGSGVVNPSSFEIAYYQDKVVLELVPYMLGVNHLDIDSLDIGFVMDFDCMGIHDEVIADALLGSSAFNCLLDMPDARPIIFSPSIVVALSEDKCTQARISVESKTSIYKPWNRMRNPDEAISLSMTIRQHPQAGEKFNALKSFENQCRLAEEIMSEKIVPNLVRPLTEAIAQKRLT